MAATHRSLDRPSRIPELAVLDEPRVEEAFRVLWRTPEDSDAATRDTVNSRD